MPFTASSPAANVMWRAWVDVATNAGAPGVDGVSIAAVGADGVDGVKAFLEELTAELRARTYRPQALRRVYIPKAGARRANRRGPCRYPPCVTGW